MLNKINLKYLLLNILPIILILVLGAYLRLYRISDYMTFLGDEGRDVLVVKRMLVDHKFTLLGPTASVGGFFLGPIYYYFMLPFLWLWHLDPTGPAVMVALFGVATIFLVYLFGQKFFGKTAGLVAALLYATSPLVIAYSRSSWNPNLMPFFSLLILYTLYQGVVSNSKKYLLSSGIFLGIAFQLHYLALFLAVIMAMYVILTNGQKIKSSVGHGLLLLLGFIIGFSPFLAFEARHDFANTQTILRFIFGGSKDTGFIGQKVFNLIPDLFIRLFWRLLTRFAPLEQINLSQDFFLEVWYWGMVAIILVSLTMLVFQYYQALKRKHIGETNKFTLIFLWLFLGIGLFAFYKKQIYDYYFGFMFPLPFLLVGMTASYLYHRKNLLVKLLVVFFVGLLFLNNWEGRPFLQPPNRQLAQAKEIARFVFYKAAGKPFNFALVTEQNSDHAYRYFFEIWGNPPVTIENFQNDPQRKTVTNQLLVICENLFCKPLGHPLWEIAGFGQAEIEGEWQVSVVKVFKLGHYHGI